MPSYRSPSRSPSSPGSEPLEVFYEDNHLVAVWKPHGLLTQGDATGDTSLLTLTKEWLKNKYAKPGEVFVGLLHRLDRPAAGVVLFAKTSKGASRLSEQFRSRRVEKRYHAWVEGVPSPRAELTHFLTDDASTRIQAFDEPAAGRKKAELQYRVLRSEAGCSLLEILLGTGRKHQIRCQLAAIGHPIVGDRKYGSGQTYVPQGIGLLAKRLEFSHPIRQEERIVVEVPDSFFPFALPAKGRA